jgi:hypothetical protein
MADTPENGPIRQQTASEGLQSVLNRHGYGFHYAILKHCLAARFDGSIPYRRWEFAVDEYPVELKGERTHIDFVLGSGTHLLVAECKRVRGVRWGFARARQSRAATAKPVVDHLYWSNDETGERRNLRRQVREFGPTIRAPFHIAVEWKEKVPKDGNETDDQKGREPKSLETAATQVLRARGGLIEDLAGRNSLRYGGGAIVPVIFTNAELIATDDDIAESDLSTGTVPRALQAQSADWLWYNSNLSAILRPSTPREVAPADVAQVKSMALSRTLRMDVTRSIAIVRTTGIEAFLRDLAIDLAHDSDPLS